MKMIPISRNVQQSTDDVHLVMYFMSLYIDFTLDMLWQRKYFVVLKANSDFPSLSASNFDLSTFPFDRQADNQTDLDKQTHKLDKQTDLCGEVRSKVCSWESSCSQVLLKVLGPLLSRKSHQLQLLKAARQACSSQLGWYLRTSKSKFSILTNSMVLSGQK